MKNKIDHGRKSFLKKTMLLGLLPFIEIPKFGKNEPFGENEMGVTESPGPLVISTWEHGMAANKAAFELLSTGGTSLDAVEAGVRISESDPEVTSVGYGGWPDALGQVTLDACIMRSNGNCGAVSYLQHIKNPISVARKVMEDTPHIMLSGDGALEFALSKGFEKENLLTEKAKNKWLEWKEQKALETPVEDHDTIGMLAIDEDGDMTGACTTSGLAWKLPGRVGDSPIIGAGLFVDGEVGAAAATGKGESVIKIAGTHLIVELMRQGASPQAACEEAIGRIIRKQRDHKKFQVGFIALNNRGEIGAYALKKGFQYAVQSPSGSVLKDAAYAL